MPFVAIHAQEITGGNWMALFGLYLWYHFKFSRSPMIYKILSEASNYGLHQMKKKTKYLNKVKEKYELILNSLIGILKSL